MEKAGEFAKRQKRTGTDTRGEAKPVSQKMFKAIYVNSEFGGALAMAGVFLLWKRDENGDIINN